MNGAEALIDTLAASGVEVCFANPGTSEMQLVAAIDRISLERKQPATQAVWRDALAAVGAAPSL